MSIRAALFRRLAAQHAALSTTYGELADAETSGDDAPYSSIARPVDSPSRRAFNESARVIDGSWKRGHIWFVPRALWHEARLSRRKRCGPSVVDVDAIIDARRSA